MGRSPCCAKEGLNRGAWTAIEDQILTAHIKVHGEGKWRSLPKRAGLKRCGKSCRLRWLNYLKPGIKRGNITPDEEELIIKLHNLLGNRWSLIAGRLPGRTDNEIKNYWNTSLSKRTAPHSSKRNQDNKSKAKVSRAKNDAAAATTTTTTTSEPAASPAAAAIRTKAHRLTKRLVLDINCRMPPTPSCNSDIKSEPQATQPDRGTYCADQAQGLDGVLYDHDDLNSLKFTAYDFQAISTDDRAANDDCTFAEDPRKLDWMIDDLFEDNNTVDLGSLTSWLEHEDWPFEENPSSKV